MRKLKLMMAVAMGVSSVGPAYALDPESRFDNALIKEGQREPVGGPSETLNSIERTLTKYAKENRKGEVCTDYKCLYPNGKQVVKPMERGIILGE